MERRDLCKGLLFGTCALMLDLQGCSVFMPDTETAPGSYPPDSRKLFMELGSCSHLYFHILSREYGYPMEAEGRALDPLTGGILGYGHQCGMLWGASMAAGAEAHRRYQIQDEAICATMNSTQHLAASFLKRTGTHDCRALTDCNLQTTFGTLKCMFFGNFDGCMDRAEKWSSEAIQSAEEGLATNPVVSSQPVRNCACMVAEQLGANDQEKVMVAGFAGGIGLSGNACGALSAAIWMNTLSWCRDPDNNCDMKNGSSPDKNADAVRTLSAFLDATHSEFLCQKISGRSFNSMEEHSEFIANGGCKKTMDALTQKLAMNMELVDIPEEGC